MNERTLSQTKLLRTLEEANAYPCLRPFAEQIEHQSTELQDQLRVLREVGEVTIHLPEHWFEQVEETCRCSSKTRVDTKLALGGRC